MARSHFHEIGKIRYSTRKSIMAREQNDREQILQAKENLKLRFNNLLSYYLCKENWHNWLYRNQSPVFQCGIVSSSSGRH